MTANELTYDKLALYELQSYYQCRNSRGWSPEASVACTLDDSTTGWQENPLQCIASIVTLSIVSVREGFFPDYLQLMLSRLRDVSDLLDEDSRTRYRDDLVTLEILIRHVPHQVITTETSFTRRVDELLPTSVVRPETQQQHGPH